MFNNDFDLHNLRKKHQNISQLCSQSIKSVSLKDEPQIFQFFTIYVNTFIQHIHTCNEIDKLNELSSTFESEITHLFHQYNELMQLKASISPILDNMNRELELALNILRGSKYLDPEISTHYTLELIGKDQDETLVNFITRTSLMEIKSCFNLVVQTGFFLLIDNLKQIARDLSFKDLCQTSTEHPHLQLLFSTVENCNLLLELDKKINKLVQENSLEENRLYLYLINEADKIRGSKDISNILMNSYLFERPYQEMITNLISMNHQLLSDEKRIQSFFPKLYNQLTYFLDLKQNSIPDLIKRLKTYEQIFSYVIEIINYFERLYGLAYKDSNILRQLELLTQQAHNLIIEIDTVLSVLSQIIVSLSELEQIGKKLNLDILSADDKIVKIENHVVRYTKHYSILVSRLHQEYRSVILQFRQDPSKDLLSIISIFESLNVLTSIFELYDLLEINPISNLWLEQLLLQELENLNHLVVDRNLKTNLSDSHRVIGNIITEEKFIKQCQHVLQQIFIENQFSKKLSESLIHVDTKEKNVYATAYETLKRLVDVSIEDVITEDIYEKLRQTFEIHQMYPSMKGLNHNLLSNFRDQIDLSSTLYELSNKSCLIQDVEKISIIHKQISELVETNLYTVVVSINPELSNFSHLETCLDYSEYLQGIEQIYGQVNEAFYVLYQPLSNCEKFIEEYLVLDLFDPLKLSLQHDLSILLKNATQDSDTILNTYHKIFYFFDHFKLFESTGDIEKNEPSLYDLFLDQDCTEVLNEFLASNIITKSDLHSIWQLMSSLYEKLRSMSYSSGILMNLRFTCLEATDINNLISRVYQIYLELQSSLPLLSEAMNFIFDLHSDTDNSIFNYEFNQFQISIEQSISIPVFIDEFNHIKQRHERYHTSQNLFISQLNELVNRLGKSHFRAIFDSLVFYQNSFNNGDFDRSFYDESNSFTADIYKNVNLLVSIDNHLNQYQSKIDHINDFLDKSSINQYIKPFTNILNEAWDKYIQIFKFQKNLKDIVNTFEQSTMFIHDASNLCNSLSLYLQYLTLQNKEVLLKFSQRFIQNFINELVVLRAISQSKNIMIGYDYQSFINLTNRMTDLLNYSSMSRHLKINQFINDLINDLIQIKSFPLDESLSIRVNLASRYINEHTNILSQINMIHRGSLTKVLAAHINEYFLSLMKTVESQLENLILNNHVASKSLETLQQCISDYQILVKRVNDAIIIHNKYQQYIVEFLGEMVEFDYFIEQLTDLVKLEFENTYGSKSSFKSSNLDLMSKRLISCNKLIDQMISEFELIPNSSGLTYQSKGVLEQSMDMLNLPFKRSTYKSKLLSIIRKD